MLIKPDLYLEKLISQYVAWSYLSHRQQNKWCDAQTTGANIYKREKHKLLCYKVG